MIYCSRRRYSLPSLSSFDQPSIENDTYRCYDTFKPHCHPQHCHPQITNIQIAFSEHHRQIDLDLKGTFKENNGTKGTVTETVIAESIPSFDVVATETPGLPYYDQDIQEDIKMPVIVSSVAQKAATATAKNDAGNSKRPAPPQTKRVNGTTNHAGNTGRPQNRQQGPQAKPVAEPAKQPLTDITPPQNQESNVTNTTTSPTASAEIPQEESLHVHIKLFELPTDNKLNSIRLRANHVLPQNKVKLVNEAKALIQAALHSVEATKLVNLGSFFSWTPKGCHLNFQTQLQAWTATENQEWLSAIGPNLKIGEQWAGMVIRDVWNTYIRDETVLDDKLKQRLYELNPYVTVSNGLQKKKEYRIRKMKWFGPKTLAIWFHDASVRDYFLNKGLFLMDGYVGKNQNLGVAALQNLDVMYEYRFPRGSNFRRPDSSPGPRHFHTNACVDCGKPPPPRYGNTHRENNRQGPMKQNGNGTNGW